MRNVLLLIVGVIGLAIVRNIIREIGKVVTRSMGINQPSQRKGEKVDPPGNRKLVRDPHTGTYVDPTHAVRARVRGTIHYFESEASRDAFVKARASA